MDGKGCFGGLRKVLRRRSNSQKLVPQNIDAALVAENPSLENNNGQGIIEEESSVLSSSIQRNVVPIGPYDEYYKMNHAQRGLLIIFNHSKFDQKTKQPVRNGTEMDVEKIRGAFQTIGFETHPYNDLSLEEIRTQVKQYQVTDYYHRLRDCLAIFVLTHGEQRHGKNLLWARDALYDPALEIWGHFTGDQCPAFAGKPKLIFIQSCLGTKLDLGTGLPLVRTEFDGNFHYTLPLYADFLFSYATFEEHCAFRNNICGSFWITVLCNQLLEHYKTRSILDIMTFVNRIIAVEFTSSNKTDLARDGRKQMPHFKSTLTRLLVFGEK